MQNQRMAEQLKANNAIAVDQCGIEKEPGVFLLDEDIRPNTIDGMDLCVKSREQWIWSVGVDDDGRLWASTDNRFYENPDYKCIWLR